MCDRKPLGLLYSFLTCCSSKKCMGEACVCSHVHTATPAGCNNSFSAGERILMETFLQQKDQ